VSVWHSPHLTEIGRAVTAMPWQWRVIYLITTVVALAGGLAVGWWML
jgi:hypothetical protein